MFYALCHSPLLWVNLLLGNLVVFLVYGEGGREPFLGLVSMAPYTAAALALFPVAYKRITAPTPWWLVVMWAALLSFAIPVLGGFLWGAGYGLADMFRYGSGPEGMLKGGVLWSFVSIIVSVYLAPPFALINVVGFFLRRRALRREVGQPGERADVL